MMIKPASLKKGDTIAILSPSRGGPHLFPHIYNQGIIVLENLGLIVKEFPSARRDAQFLYENPKFRAKDINDAFADKNIKAVFASIGGDDSIRILPYINIEIIKSNPKIMIGYSDTTTLLTYFNQLGIITLHGSTIMAGFSQWDTLGKAFQEHVGTILFDNPESYLYKSFPEYCEGYLDWKQPTNVGKTKPMSTSTGWNWIQGKGEHKGLLFGGCIEILEFMKGTVYFPRSEFWHNKILFLETSEEKPTPAQVKYILRSYGIQGIFDKISGLLVGRPRGYSETEIKELEINILTVVKEEFGNTTLPIISNMDFGHTDPQRILPLGIEAKIDCNKKEFKLIEKIFKD